MNQLTQNELTSKIHNFLDRKTTQLHLTDDPLEGIQPRMHDIRDREILDSYKYIPLSSRKLFHY